jgi:multidrug efflux pump subunit AcrA (membrane-fusion protein)
MSLPVTLVDSYINLVGKIVVAAWRFYRTGQLDLPRRAPYAATLEKLDTAKRNVTEALVALDRLRSEYSTEMVRLEKLITDTETKRTEYQSTLAQLKDTKNLLANDQAALREALGINDRLSKVVGFISGVFASLVATALWFAVPAVIRLLKELLA